MAFMALRCRRILPTISTLVNNHLALSSVASISRLPEPLNSTTSPFVQFQSRLFRSSPISMLCSTSLANVEKVDYNHWLITIDFPKDPKPTADEMVEAYVQTCAKGLNISVEEAKKKIYACSTTTYQGFQAVMTETESEKFEGLPGVVFVLPDSYIDPVNKECGGDEYINGTIIPRLSPIQYNRGRNDRNKPRYDMQRPPPQGKLYIPRGPMQGDGRNYGTPQNIPQQNYGSPGQVPPPPPPPGRIHFGERGSNLNQPGQGNYYPQHRRGLSSSEQRGFGPSGTCEFGDHRNYSLPAGTQNFEPSPNQNFGTGGGGDYASGGRHRGGMKGISGRGNSLCFGRYALQALEPTWITSRQIEAGRRAITRNVCRGGKIWVRIFPDKPVTKRPAETRMGKGKGSFAYRVAVVKPGRILYEIGGVAENVARKAIQIAASKMPLQTRFIHWNRNVK
ncbi:unnamed protein product [Rhodiola kirilowii]